MSKLGLGVGSEDGEPTPPYGHPSSEGIYMRGLENISQTQFKAR